MKKFVTSFLLCIFLNTCLLGQGAFCRTIWADDSLNDVIIKEYDSNALRDEYLPVLPESLKQESQKKNLEMSVSQQQAQSRYVEKALEPQVKESVSSNVGVSHHHLLPLGHP